VIVTVIVTCDRCGQLEPEAPALQHVDLNAKPRPRRRPTNSRKTRPFPKGRRTSV
jgi:hypothetical protein